MSDNQAHFVPSTPETLGNFRLIRAIGEGSTGIVYLAERIDFPQRVAIKLLHVVTYLRSSETDLEPNLLASLDHNNIVRLLDQGISREGQRYLVMEYVEGISIDQFCDANHLSITSRIELLIKVMAGVSYAHRNLVVHADLKPSNILVDTNGEPKLLDFGSGADIKFTDTSHPQNTLDPTFTPAFASPEQLRGGPISVATDIYSLGMIALRLLSGARSHVNVATPFPATDELKRQDSAHLKTLADARATTPAHLRRILTGNIDAILAKALDSDPDQRYDSVELFSHDLRAHLENWPISARPATSLERASKWVKRHRALAYLGFALSAAILISSAGVIWQITQAERQRLRTQATLHELVSLTGTLDGELYDSIHSLDQGDKARNALLTSANQALDRIAANATNDSALFLELAEQYARLARLQQENSASNKSSHSAALADIDKAISLIKRISPSDRYSFQAQKTLQQLLALKSSMMSS